jgi:hypothetical protein
MMDGWRDGNVNRNIMKRRKDIKRGRQIIREIYSSPTIIHFLKVV